MGAPEPMPRRWWRWPLGLAVGAILCLGLAVLVPWLSNYLVASRGKAELAAVLAEIERADPRWRWEHLEKDRPPVANEENSVRVLREVVAALPGSSLQSWPRYSGDDLLDLLYGQRPPNRRLDAKWLADLRALHGKRERAVTLAMSLSRYPCGRADVDLAPADFRTQVPDGMRFCTVVTLLAQEHERLLHAGRGVDAADGIRAQLHAGAAFRDAPHPSLQRCRLEGRRDAVRRVERLLGMGEVPAETCRRLQAHLVAERAEAPLVAVVRGLRGAFHSRFIDLEVGRVPLTNPLAAAIGASFKSSASEVQAIARSYPPRLFADHAACLRILHRGCTIARLPPWEQLDAWPACQLAVSEARLEAMYQKRSLLTAWLLTPLPDVREYVRDQALLSCAVVALAAEQFRLEQQRWPEAAADLTPTFLDTLPTDPFTGKPLLYARGEEGIRISCVDPGGKDVAIQVWNADRRGLPPVPPKAAGNPP